MDAITWSEPSAVLGGPHVLPTGTERITAEVRQRDCHVSAVIEYGYGWAEGTVDGWGQSLHGPVVEAKPQQRRFDRADLEKAKAWAEARMRALVARWTA